MSVDLAIRADLCSLTWLTLSLQLHTICKSSGDSRYTQATAWQVCCCFSCTSLNIRTTFKSGRDGCTQADFSQMNLLPTKLSKLLSTTNVSMILGCPRWLSFTPVLSVTSVLTPKSEYTKGNVHVLWMNLCLFACCCSASFVLSMEHFYFLISQQHYIINASKA